MSQLICKDLCLGYESREIAHNINFSVDAGDYLCIVGENGSGKTTLMRTLLGLHQPMSGSIRIGEDLRRSQIGYLPQQTAAQKDFPASVKEIVLSGCQNKCGMRPFYSKSEKETAAKIMDKMGISHLAKRCYRELSGGQQQRVLLARALCATEKMLLLDEPVSGLDPKATDDMYNTIYELNKKDGITVLMISHDIGTALRYASHVLYIGSDVFFGTKTEYLSSDICAKLVARERGEL